MSKERELFEARIRFKRLARAYTCTNDGKATARLLDAARKFTQLERDEKR